MSLFGWSLPPGCGALPGEEEQAIDVCEGKALKGYGRTQHGLCGKDADLDEEGQVVINEAWWHEDGTIEIRCRYYATIAPEEEYEFQADEDADALTTEEQATYDPYTDYCTELLVGSDYPGEWTGDDWSIGGDLHIRENFDWDDAKTDEQNIEAATAKAYDLVMDHPEVKALQEEMGAISRTMEKEQWDAGHAGATE